MGFSALLTNPATGENKRETPVIDSKSQIDSAVKQEGGILVPFSILVDKNLTLTDKIVYSYILSFNINGAGFFQSSEATANRLQIQDSTVRRSLARLRKLCYVKRYSLGTKSYIECIKLCEPVANEHSTCSNLLQSLCQIDTHNNNINNNIINKREGSLHSPSSISSKENNYNNQTESQITDLESPNKPNLIKQTKEGSRVETNEVDKPIRKRKEPSTPSCAAPLLPTFPDENDTSLRVRLSQHDAQRLEEKLGLRQLLTLCSQIETYLQDNPKKRYSDFYKTILNWARRSAERGLVFGYNRVTKMWGYFPMWQVGKHVELERDMEGSDD